jgi:hypothetical protein
MKITRICRDGLHFVVLLLLSGQSKNNLSKMNRNRRTEHKNQLPPARPRLGPMLAHVNPPCQRTYSPHALAAHARCSPAARCPMLTCACSSCSPTPTPASCSPHLLLPRVRVRQLLVFLPWLCRGGGKNEDFGPYAQVGILDVWAMPSFQCSFSFFIQKSFITDGRETKG